MNQSVMVVGLGLMGSALAKTLLRSYASCFCWVIFRFSNTVSNIEDLQELTTIYLSVS